MRLVMCVYYAVMRPRVFYTHTHTHTHTHTGHLQVKEKDVLCGRWLVVRLLGTGTFSRVIECVDLKAAPVEGKTRQAVALKLVKRVQKYCYAAGSEIAIHSYLFEHTPLFQQMVGACVRCGLM
jgi:hypothetical protein